MRPRWGLRPTRPQQAAGIRSRAAAVVAVGDRHHPGRRPPPPSRRDEPPGVRAGSHGLRVGPKRRGSVTGRIPHSGSVVVPTITKPASRSRAVTLWSFARLKSPISRAPKVRRRPATARLFLIAIGTPANGRSSPGRSRRPWRSASSAYDVDERVERRRRARRSARATRRRARGRRARRADERRELGHGAEHQVGGVGHAADPSSRSRRPAASRDRPSAPRAARDRIS